MFSFTIRLRVVGCGEGEVVVEEFPKFFCEDRSELGVFVKTSSTPEVTLRKSGVEGGWGLASPYVVHPCLHTQWSHISGLVKGGGKGLL